MHTYLHGYTHIYIYTCVLVLVLVLMLMPMLINITLNLDHSGDEAFSNSSLSKPFPSLRLSLSLASLSVRPPPATGVHSWFRGVEAEVSEMY